MTSGTSPDKLDTIKDESEEDEDEEDDEEEEPMSALSSKQQPKRPAESRTRTHSITRPQRSRKQSTASAYTQEQPSIPSSEVPLFETPVSQASQRGTLDPSQHWRQLKPDLKPEMEKYLRFQHDSLTFYHYLFKVDPADFVHGELIDLALSFEPLLHAVVAFAAYHHTVRLPDAQANFNDFWKYYCKSIVKLRKHLESTEERDDLVLLTVLQLATFEECMGDWTNLSTHHKAAYGILISKYTPQTIMETDRGRKMFDWFFRLDVTSGLMAVRDVSLDRAWIDYALQWHEQRCHSEEGNKPHVKLQYFSKSIEILGQDAAHTFVQANITMQQGSFTIENVLHEIKQLTDRLHDLRQQIQQLNHPAYSGIEEDAPHNEDEAFNSKVPLFRDELWSLNIVWLNWYGMLMVLKKQTLLVLQKAQGQTQLLSESNKKQLQTIPLELTAYAKIQCEIFNAINTSRKAPKGAALICYATLGLSAVFLPRAPPASNSRYTMWARKQLASIERQGYVWPPHFRREMAQLFQDPEIEDWWLPNGQGKTRLLDEIRMVVKDRYAAAMRSGNDDGRNDLREIRGVFEKMDINMHRRGSSTALDPAYINSSVGMAHAASLVSTPEYASSGGGSVQGFSPRASAPELEKGKRSRKSSRASNESPLMQTMSAPGNRMSGIWEEQQR